ncbi:MAG: bifunctional aspartate carbamoyltransferase catalytic subunit/aspartate carbamoyltransferase regulatory subunit [Spirochaetia bacterium]|nr:bifunctional aspartate carbamoyltransferase catalytic subunit/aspartate carbamoyltransferase regulatory subunit [Spirochaetia bacterium]
MGNIFTSRTLSVIDDMSISERRYLFEKTKILKDAFLHQDEHILNSFRINNSDFGIYEVFLEDSTRTRESFRNAAAFHKVKVSDLAVDTSSFNKGESYADTFNTLAGYQNSVFIIRSKLEGVCTWLHEATSSFAERNNLSRIPAFINAGDGKHEHPTQELLDEFTFLEDNNFETNQIHLALVGDLYHGRTVHSKANGLTLFNKVKVDLIAPPEIAMPEYYVEKMKSNGFEVRLFDSIEEYISQKDIATKWYFTRPQLERMGEKILKREAELRNKVTLQKEYLKKIPQNAKFYHPLPRHRVHPTIPTFVDETSFNGYERQSINGMYVRIVLLAMIAGTIGDDFTGSVSVHERNDEEYIIEVPPHVKGEKETDGVSEGVRPIRDGIVIDHIGRGEEPSVIRKHMALIIKVLNLDNSKGGEWVSTSKNEDHKNKGIIFRPGVSEFSRKELKRLAAVAAGATLNIIKDGKIEAKYRTHLPPRIYNFDDLACTNESCISHPIHNEGVPARFFRTKDNRYVCAYCQTEHDYHTIWR